MTGQYMGGDPETDLLYWLTERADDLGIPWEAAQTWPGTVAFVAGRLGVSEAADFESACAILRRRGHIREQEGPSS